MKPPGFTPFMFCSIFNNTLFLSKSQQFTGQKTEQALSVDGQGLPRFLF